MGKSVKHKLLSALIESIDTREGRRRLAKYLEQQPFPHYRPHPEIPRLLERIDEDGTRTFGRFVNREFKAVRISGTTTSSNRNGGRSDGSKPLRTSSKKAAKIKSLRHEFDQLLARMQTHDFRAAMDSLFQSSPKGLGKAALKITWPEARRP